MSQTPIQQKIRNKTITGKQLAEKVKTGDWIRAGGPGGDPTVCIEAICQRLGDGPGQIKNIEIWDSATMLGSNFLTQYDLEAKYHVAHVDFLMTTYRAARDKKGYEGNDWRQMGWAIHSDHDHAAWYRKNKSDRVMDWGIQSIAKPEGNYVNSSYATNIWMSVAKTCKKLVCEVRDDHAWCEGGRNNVLPIDDVDYFVEVNTSNPKYQWPAINEKALKPTDVEQKIADNIVGIMRDGDCIQVGIGNLPTAVVIALEDSNLRHLGVHSEMIGEYAFRLTEKGIIDNSKKQIDRGRCAWAYMIPFDTKRYFEWLHHNPYFAAYDINYTNNFVQIAQNDSMVAINNFAMMDLYGQDCCGMVDHRVFSGTGGQLQFIVGCTMSKGGRAVLAATSRDKSGQSRFVPGLPTGSSVDIPAQFVTYIATEYGVVNLLGASGYDRAKRIISVAHPDDREWLEKEAYKLGLKPNHWMFSVDRRSPSDEHLREHKMSYMDLKITANPIVDMTD